MFEYIFASIIDTMMVLLFCSMLFMLIVKDDSPMRAVSPVAQYLTLKGRQKAEDKEFVLRSEAEETETEDMSHIEQKKIDTSSTTFLVAG